MLKGNWKDAREIGKGDCAFCSRKRNLRMVHYVGTRLIPRVLKDHLKICAQCFHIVHLDDWHACGSNCPFGGGG